MESAQVESLKKFIELVGQNPEMRNRLTNEADPDKQADLASKYARELGVTIDVAALKAMKYVQPQKAAVDLSDDELEAVAGGKGGGSSFRTGTMCTTATEMCTVSDCC